MRRLVRTLDERLLPQGWIDLLRQVALFMAPYLLYELVRGLVAANALEPGPRPFDNATHVIGLERTLHLFVEPQIQSWTAGQRWLMDAADWAYLNAHLLVTLGALTFIYLRRNNSFYFVRNMFLVAMGIALIGYAAFPTAPPRLMPQWGFTDSIRQFTGVQLEHSSEGGLVNLYAAIPSMHVCFATMVGGSMARLMRNRLARVAWSVYPLVVTFVVIATGNHYITDVVLGALTASAAALLSHRLLARARPRAWAFGGVPA
jgi:membrane-associated phospholipid phosphatase